MITSQKQENEWVADFVKSKSSTAFEKIYNLHFDYVYKFVFSRVGNHVWTQDIVSETFITLVDIMGSFNYSSKLRSFIIGIALNKIRQFYTKKVRENETSFDEEFFIMEEEEPEDEEKEENLRKNLKDVLRKLDQKYREVLEARFLKCLSIKETALKLQITETNVKVRQKRAIEKAVVIANQLFNKKEAL